MQTDVSGQPAVRGRRTSPQKVAWASFIGTALEWYDYFIYGAAAAIVFGPLFFPNYSATAGTLAAFATYSVGFVARPLGGILMGYFGDRIGRKPMLITSLVMVGGATFLVGLLPTYDSIGVWAPILLVTLRFIQGLGVGGEWGGAVLMATEHAPAGRRSFYGSFPQMGLSAGVITANLVFLVVSSNLDRASFASWGWRVPFLLSAVMVIGGLVLRRAVEESPEFVAARERDTVTRTPFTEVFRTSWKQILIGAGCMIGTGTMGYVLSLYVLSYTTGPLGLPRTTILTVTLISAGWWLVLTPVAAILADRVGQRRVLLVGAVGLSLSTAILFPLLDTGRYGLILLGMMLVATFVAITYSPVAGLLAGMFHARVRYSGTSMAYQFGTVLGGGIAPLVATALFARTGSSTPIAIYLTLLTLVSLVAVTFVGRSERVKTRL